MSDITLTSSMRANLSSLRMISGQMGKTQERLSTGLKVNSAIDNASSYYQARSLTNRAADLNALLDSMGQGIQTINAAIEGLESGTAFLEQATAVATEALAIAKIPSKEWFTNQEGVAAVVSSWSELKETLDSGKVGDIVIYGQIECQDTITLQSGQNLVGIGYYGVEDKTTDKFSQLNFDLNALDKTQAIKTSGDGITIADISLKSVMCAHKRSQLVSLKNNNKLHNIDILMDVSQNDTSAISCGLSGGSVVMTGKNSIGETAFVRERRIETSAVGCNLDLYGELNINLSQSNSRAFWGYHLNTYQNSKLNVVSAMNATDGAVCHFYDNSEVNLVGPNGFCFGELHIHDAVRVNIKATNYGVCATDIFPLSVNLHSTSAMLNIAANRLFGQSSAHKLIFNAVSGAKFGFNGKVYQAEKDVSDNQMNGNNLPDGFVATAATIIEPDSLDWLKEANSGRTIEYKQDKIKNSKEYQKIFDEYDRLIEDSSYQGINLLKNGKLAMTFNESRSHKFSVQGNDMSAQGFGLSTAAWMTQGDVAKSLSEIASALNSIRNFQSELGNNYQIIQTRQNFTEKLGDILEAGSDNLTLADMNEESANYLALQTRQQLAINSLSLAAQSAQSILSLF